MVRTYIRKTSKASWTPEQLSDAINEIQNGALSIRAAGREYGIPESTLRKKIKISGEMRYTKGPLGGVATFTPEQEKEFVRHILLLAKMFYGMAARTLRKLAYDYAEVSSIKHSFNKDLKMAGIDWYYGFLSRNKEVSLRKPEPTSINRIKAFNTVDVTLFFENLSALYDKFKFRAENIYNVDETGITTVQKPSKCLGPRGIKQFGCRTSAERGKNVTVICAFSASGKYIAPMFIFPRKRMTDLLEKNGPVGSLYRCSPTGWSNETLFIEWLSHFAKSAKPTANDPVLVIMDNHSSHISLPIYTFCRENHISLLTLPPHTSHRLQPLDLTFFGPLKAAYNKECDMFLRNAERITTYDLAELFNKSFIRSATIDKAISGFGAAGIFPLQMDKFNEEEFTVATQFFPVTLTDNVGDIGPKKNQLLSINEILQTESKPSTSKAADVSLQEYAETKISHVTVEALSPVPQPGPSTIKQTSRQKQKSVVLTTTPYKDELLEAENRKKRRISLQKVEQTKKKSKSQTKKKGAVSNLFIESDSNDDPDLDEDKICDDDEMDDIGNPAEDTCLVCADVPRKKEQWYRCTLCSRWAHALCSGQDKPENYICDFC